MSDDAGESPKEHFMRVATGGESTIIYRTIVTAACAYLGIVSTNILRSNDELKDAFNRMKLDVLQRQAVIEGRVGELGERINAISSRVTLNDGQIGDMNKRLIDILRGK